MRIPFGRLSHHAPTRTLAGCLADAGINPSTWPDNLPDTVCVETNSGLWVCEMRFAYFEWDCSRDTEQAAVYTGQDAAGQSYTLTLLPDPPPQDEEVEEAEEMAFRLSFV